MFVPAGGFLLNCVDFGSGPTTFVAHGGWVGNWELWQQPFEIMHKRWRCIAYDHRGSGASTAPPEAITPEGLVDDLFAVLDAHGVERCVVAGESMGAISATLAVLRQPERFDGLVIVDGAPFITREETAPLIDGSRTDYTATVRSFVDNCVPEADSDHIRRWGRQILLRADPEAAARIFEVHADEKVVPDFASVAVPTLVIHGEKDVVVPLAAGQYMASAIPGAQLVVLPDTGHVPTLTRPAELVNAIENWWSQLH